jgi:hypothetical protein
MKLANRIRPTVTLDDDRGTIVHSATNTRPPRLESLSRDAVVGGR